ncbi:hypothetical protein [Halobacteriovorax sp. JY17]|uniref:hypothetical protein n=1 Tax=Halobacteriovorax sp. JY17 TaxID=2014617 RepID=UPI000C4EFF74|nr:hypothetical protein [Halobacteriovorax sp. JY17]PIK15635.1 MAG: hypothetical protein CES88_02605 [Halobacteriovorax sp. JY17]
MLKNLFKSKEKFVESFTTELQQLSPHYLSLDLQGSTLKSVWEESEYGTLGLELSRNSITLTNLSGRTKKVNNQEELRNLILLQSKKVILEKIEQAKKEIHLFPNISNPTEGELKGEEWLKVTNHVLKESLKKASRDDSLVVEAKLFLGRKQGEEEFSVRLQCYNLDYSLTFLNNGKLYLSVFDDKNFSRGHAEKPSYNGEFYNNRPMILDEFIKLIYEIFSLGKIKIFS